LSAVEITRATIEKGNHFPLVDFVTEARQCRCCGSALHVQKSKKRIVITMETGTIQAREIRKVCSVDLSHPVEISGTLARMVPAGQRYGYDLIVEVGTARYLRNMQRQEICTELLREKNIILSTGTISKLCDRFLLYLEALHLNRASALRAAMDGGYPLHIDATCEYGKGGLFLCLDGFRGWVLHAVKITTENSNELYPAIEKTISLFGDPIAIMRDLGSGGAKSVKKLRQKGIPDLVCHYHFLGAVGKKLFDVNYSVLRNLLRQSKVRTKLRELLRELRRNQSADVYDGKLGHGRMREDLLALVLWVLEGTGGKDLPFPFCLPHLNFYQRCCEVTSRAERWVPFPRSHVERRVFKQLSSILTQMNKLERFAWIVPSLKENWTSFCELRDILRLTNAEYPRGDRRNLTNQESPDIEVERLQEIKKNITLYQEKIQQNVANAKAEKTKNIRTSPESIILKYLDRYKKHLFGHPIIINKAGQIIGMVNRTNNGAEHFFGDEKQKIRRRVGRANLGRDLEDQPAQATLVSNLNHTDYVEIVCGSLDQLPDAFAQLDRKKLEKNSVLQRSNKDVGLKKCICALIADEKNQKEENNRKIAQLTMQATEF